MEHNFELTEKDLIENLLVLIKSLFTKIKGKFN